MRSFFGRKSSARSVLCGWMTGLVLAGILAAAAAQAQFTNRQFQQKKSSTSIEEPIRKVNSSDPNERLEGVRELSGSRDAKAVEYLIQAVGDTDLRVRAKAVEALGVLRATEATQVLVQQLLLRSTEPQMKQRILASLGKIGDPRATRPILEFLQRDLDAQMRGTAIFALGDIGSSEAVDTLRKIEAEDEDPTTRRLAGEALNKIQHFQAVKAKEAKGPADTFLPKPPEQPGQ
jgi:HEAT repeat protein